MTSRRAFVSSLVQGTVALALGTPRSGSAAAAEQLETVVMGPTRMPIWPNLPTEAWTFGGALPGPTLRVGRGAVFSLRVENRLAEATNVHWHGLLAPAEMDGYPTDLIPSGASRDYAFRVDDPAGTYWYHPHPDARTATQVYQGLAGFLIVEDDAEPAGLPRGERDVPLLLQDRRRTRDGSLTYAPTPMDVMSGYLGDAALVGGVPNASLAVSADPYRLRLLNGSNARVLRLAFSDQRAFHVIGGDAGLIERPVAARELDLGPGERVEIVADFSSDPVGRVLALTSLAFGAGGGRFGMPGMGGASAQGAPLELLALRVDRPGRARERLPEQLVTLERADPSQASHRRSFVLQMGMGPFGDFTINGASFRPDRVDTRVARGDLEIWDVTAASGEPHPFHVHGARFRVLDRNGAPPQAHELGWKDTALVWGGDRVRLLVRVGEQRGLFVLHCHNLEHEDAGMMANLEIV